MNDYLDIYSNSIFIYIIIHLFDIDKLNLVGSNIICHKTNASPKNIV